MDLLHYKNHIPSTVKTYLPIKCFRRFDDRDDLKNLPFSSKHCYPVIHENPSHGVCIHSHWNVGIKSFDAIHPLDVSFKVKGTVGDITFSEMF